jgi:PAS domain S-box-containing protein
VNLTTEHIQSILDSLPVSVALIGPDLKLCYANTRLLAALGGDRESILGRTCSELGMSISVWGDWQSHIRKVFSTGENSRIDYITQFSGADQLLRVKFTPLRDASQAVTHVIAMALVDHELEDLRQTLANSEQRFHAFMDALPLVAWLRDEEERYVYLNPAYQRVMNADPKEWYGKHLRDKWPTETAERFLENDQKLLQDGRPVQIEEEGQLPSGENRVWYNTKFAYRDALNRLFFGGVAIDVTPMKEAEKSRIRFEKQMLQAQKYESLGVLAGGVAHDFNNILTSILGTVTLCKMQSSQLLDQTLLQQLTQIESSALRAADLCQQMLAYSGRGQMIVKTANVNAIIEQMQPLLIAAIRKQSLLKLHLSEQVMLVDCDPSQVRQVVMNLVTNASDAIGEQSGVISVTTGLINADAKYLEDLHIQEPLLPGQYVYIEVADTGTGISEEVRSRIFEPFYSTKFVGRGLGLSAVQGIMRGHNGCVKVYTHLGKGSTFKVLFPIVEPSASATPDSNPELELPPMFGNQRLVLVVDDEEDIRVLTRKILESVGFQTILAANGREAVELFRERSQDIELVIMDLTMPKLSGSEAFQAMRGVRSDVKVILTSGYNESDATSSFSGLGGFLRKPFRMHELLKMVQKQFSY